MSPENVKKINDIYRLLPTNGSYKSVQKELNALADLLPKTAYEMSYAKREQIVDLTKNEIKRGGFSDIGVIDQRGPMVTTEALEFLETKDTTHKYHNNSRMLKKAWKSNGKEGIRLVVKYIDTNNKNINSEHRTKTVMKVADTIIREKIKPIFN